MGGDSCCEGRGFESWYHKNCNDDCLKIPIINDKRGRCWPIFYIKKLIGVLRTVQSISASTFFDQKQISTNIRRVAAYYLAGGSYLPTYLSMYVLYDSNQNIQRSLYSAKSVTSLVTSNDLFDMQRTACGLL